jgi:type IV secretion system protein VirB9
MGMHESIKTPAAGAILLLVAVGAPAVRSAAQPSSGGVVGAARLEAIWSDVEEELRLRRHDKEALKLLRDYGLNRDIDKPHRGSNGSIVFSFGATQVRIICAPLRVCDVALQPGEIVTGMHIGDRGRWGILPADVGKGPTAATHVVIKPHAANLHTNLVIHTDRRVYQLELVSRKKDHMPLVSFSYPDDARAAWEAYLSHRREESAEVAMDLGRASIEDVNTDYEISGDEPPWRPRAVYDNGERTCIKMPQGLRRTEAPVLLLEERKQMQIVNYRVRDGCYVVDRLFEKAVMINGIGKQQQRVEIQKKHEKKRRRRR